MRLKHFLLPIILALTFFTAPAPKTHAANAQNFRISDYNIDYYLTKTDENTSNLHVKETIVAEFPNTDQNHGITRTIPRTNQNGANVTVQSKESLNLSVTRNGLPEPISGMDENNKEYTAYIGNASEYVHGSQTYVLEYDFADVITEFDDSGANLSGKNSPEVAFQELYWDTNGTGWLQSIDRLTANLHLPSDIANALQKERTSCYVGQYGSNDSTRCKIEHISDGYSFSTSSLAPDENLTLAVDFAPQTFAVVLRQDYAQFLAILAIVLICVTIILILYYLWHEHAQSNYKLYKSLFVTPQYLAPKDLSIAEAQHVYLKKVRPPYVATLLELAVQRKITIKAENEQDWSVILNVEPDSLSTPDRNVLEIIAYKTALTKGAEIPVKSHYATAKSRNCAAEYSSESAKTLVKKGYRVEKPYTGTIFKLFLIFIIVFVFCAAMYLLVDSGNFTFDSLSDYLIVYGGAAALFAFFVAVFWFMNRITLYSSYTEEGIRKARYLDGLKQYIRLAESERLAFMQSVKGADTSTAGLVHLYEKLLPWACLFGVEKSWAAELSKYYDVLEQENYAYSPVYNHYMMHGIVAGSVTSRLNNTIASSSASSSSSSSGGGGGGFSGGGGGGGGGGGW